MFYFRQKNCLLSCQKFSRLKSVKTCNGQSKKVRRSVAKIERGVLEFCVVGRDKRKLMVWLLSCFFALKLLSDFYKRTYVTL